MSETVLAALIAASATILTTLLQLKISLGRGDGPAARSTNSSRKKPKLPAMLLGVMLSAAAVGGFALSQWFGERERVQQQELRQELQARITEISRTAGELKQTKLDQFAEVEVDVLRRMGGSGIVALATVGACHGTPANAANTSAAAASGTTATPSSQSAGSSQSTRGSTGVTSPANAGAPATASTSALAAVITGPAASGAAAVLGLNAATANANGSGTTPGNAASTTQTPADSASTATPEAASASDTTSTAPTSTCAEADATPVLLCAPIPSNAVVSHVDLFTRYADADEPWNTSQVAAGQDVGQARFSEKKQESLADDGMKHVCHKFANWSTQHARVARMIVRYAIPAEALEPQTQVRHKAIVGSTGALAIR